MTSRAGSDKPCPFCGFRFRVVRRLRDHIAEHHPSPSIVSVGLFGVPVLPVIEVSIDSIHSSAIVAEKAKAACGAQ
jgi:hypothetical protein